MVISHTDDGGVIYTVKPRAFTFNSNYGSLETDGYVIPYDHRIRNGCFLSTPWFPVNHPDGEALGFPHVTLEWRGKLHPEHEPDKTLLRLQLEVKKPDGTHHRVRSFMYTEIMSLQPQDTDSEGWVSYSGRLDNPLASGEDKDFGSIAVSKMDEVRYSVCDLYEGGSLVIRDLKVLSRPIP